MRLLKNHKSRKITARRVRWVRDLVSGNYTQGKGALKMQSGGSTKHCCLGVACEGLDPEYRELNLTHGTSIAYIIDKNAKKFGLTKEDQSEASRWNDTLGYDFDRIADMVAFATEFNTPFTMSKPIRDSVNHGYAIEWLKQYDS